MMKLIEIELANQPVILPADPEMTFEGETIKELLNTTDIIKEQKVSTIFSGSLLAPVNIWQASSDKHAHKKPCKTMVMKRAIVEEDEANEVYYQELSNELSV